MEIQQFYYLVKRYLVQVMGCRVLTVLMEEMGILVEEGRVPQMV